MWFPLRLGKLDKPINAFALCCVSTKELWIYDLITGHKREILVANGSFTRRTNFKIMLNSVILILVQLFIIAVLF